MLVIEAYEGRCIAVKWDFYNGLPFYIDQHTNIQMCKIDMLKFDKTLQTYAFLSKSKLSMYLKIDFSCTPK